MNGSGDSYDIDKCNIEVGYYDRPERLIIESGVRHKERDTELQQNHTESD